MTWNLDEFKKLVDAEEYLEFFQIPYDAQVVNVNRLHILKKFSQYVKEIDATSAGLNTEEKLNQYRAALASAYEVFLSSNSLEQKLFKVFNDKPQNVVMLNDIN